jgi:DNA-binding NarL/FixJ family response regulator
MMLLDRDREVAALDERVAEARDGSGRLVLIEGPAGIGKSGLLAELRERARPRLRILSARASELEREFAFGVVRQLFEAEVAARGPGGPLAGATAGGSTGPLAGAATPGFTGPLPGAPARDSSDPLAGAAAPAAAVFASAPGAAGEGDASFAALHGLFWLTLNLAAEHPLLLAVDDLHWCDRPSLRFLAYVARRLDGVPALVATTLRSSEPGTDPALLAELAHDPGTVALRPGPLGEDAVRALVRGELGAGADERFCAACHEATGGNPLLLRQLLRTLEAEGVPPDAAHADEVRAVGPRAVASTVLLRLARLPHDAVAVARAVSVLGESAELPVVAALAELGEPAVAAAARALVRAEILRPEPPLAFVHPLVRDAVYHELPPGGRELQHERAAQALRASGADTEHVAAQLLAAPRRGEEWVSALLEEAAAAAMGKGAADSAAAYLRRALQEPPAPERRTPVLLTLGEAEALTHGPTGAERLHAAYDAVDDPVVRAQVGGGLARLLMFTGTAEESSAIARDAAAGLPQGHEDLRRWLEANELVNVFWGDDTPRMRERLARYRRAPGDDGLGSNSLAAMAAFEWAYAGGGAEKCCAIALEAIRAGDLIARDNGPIPVCALLVFTLADRDEAVEFLDDALAEAHTTGSVLSTSGNQLWHGFARLRRGDLAEAEALLRSSIALTNTWGFSTIGERYPTVFLAATLLMRGDVAGARRELDRTSDTGDTADSTRWQLMWKTRLLAAEGRWDEVIASAEVMAERFAWVANPSACGWREPLAEALSRLERPAEALAVAEENLELARRWGAPGTVGPALRALGTLRGEEGLPLLEEAVAVLESSSARLEHARALAALGATLRRARRPGEAREPLRRALELAAACDATGLAEHVRTELYASGARPRTDALAGAAALTASERRVAELAATGETNRDVAQALFVTPKTVEVHLSNAYRKLGIRSRRELAAALAEPSTP